MFLNVAFRVSAFRVSASRVWSVLRFRCVWRFACHCVARSAFVRFAAYWRFVFRMYSVSELRHLRLSSVSRFVLKACLRFGCASPRFDHLRFGVLRFTAFHV